MSDLTAKAAYLKGLADGMKLDETTDVNRLTKSMIELLGEMAEKFDGLDGEVGFLADNIETIEDELDSIDSELDSISDILCGCDSNCGHDDDSDFEIICPACNQSIVLDMDAFDDEATCPLCGEEIEFDFNFDTEEDM